MANAVGDVNVVLSVNAVNFTQGVKAAQSELDKFAGKSKAAGHSTVSSMQAASASIREMNGNFVNNTRAVERFITTIPGVGNVLKAAFPLVGGLAFGSMIVDAGMKVADFIKKTSAMPKAIQDGFASLHLASQSSTDALRLANDTIQNTINKLEGKPQNNLAIQLDEARIKADDLAKSLENDATKVKALIEQNKISALGGLATGQAGTAGVTGTVNYGLNEIQHLGKVNRDAVGAHGADSPEAKKALADLQAKQSYYMKWAASQLFLRDNPQYATDGTQDMAGDQTGNRNILMGFQGVLQDSKDNQAEQDRNGKLKPQQEAAQASHDAAIKAAEARKQAAREFLQGLETDQKAWEQAQKLAEDMQKATADHNLEFFKSNGLSNDDSKSLDEAGKSANAYIQSLSQSIALSKENADAMAMSSLQMAVATGQMTKLDAAQVLANMHTQDYNKALADLKIQRESIASDPQYSDLARKAALQDNTNRQDALNGNRQIQVADDHQNTNPTGSSALVGATDALNDFVAASRDGATQMRELVGNTLQGLNQQIVAAMSGQKTDFGNFGAGVFRSVANTGLQKAEGYGLSALGFGGKADGSSDKPFYVKIAKDASDVAKSAGGFLSKVFGGGNSSGSNSLASLQGLVGNATEDDAAAGGIGTIASDFADMIPMLASGGPISGPAIVGEEGPELFNPGTSGTIIPNHKLSSVVGNGGGHTINIDASGSTDPAQTRVQVMRGIQAAAPHISAATISSQRQDNRRTPPSRRKS